MCLFCSDGLKDEFLNTHASTFFMDQAFSLTQLSDLSLSLLLFISGVLIPLQEFSFTQVWYSNQQPVHCAFSLQRHSASATQLSCKISVRQVKGHEQILQVYTSVGEVGVIMSLGLITSLSVCVSASLFLSLFFWNEKIILESWHLTNKDSF